MIACFLEMRRRCASSAADDLNVMLFTIGVASYEAGEIDSGDVLAVACPLPDGPAWAHHEQHKHTRAGVTALRNKRPLVLSMES